MQRSTGAAVAVAGITAVAAGCGGGDGKTYSASATADCLRSRSARVDTQHMDVVARANHGFYVRRLESGGAVNVSFGDVSEIRKAYRPFMTLEGTRIDSTGNAVLHWDTYTPAADSEVRGCLR